MLSIAERSSDACTVLRHGEGVFHEALELVKKGESRFHAEGPDGTAYDLVYTENMQLFSRQMYMLITQITKGSALYAPFLDYDENDTENICLAFLGQFRRMEIETADEYSIAAARLALRHTDMEIWCRDGRISWFIGESGRLRITEELPEKGGADILRITGNPMEFGYAKRDWSRLCSAAVFQNLFFWQAFARGKQVKYMQVALFETEGIGGVLSSMSVAANLAALKGWKAYLKPGSTRYPDRMLKKYFNIPFKPEDATESNTAFVDDIPCLYLTWLRFRYPANYDAGILNPRFRAEMEEYAEAVFRGRKILGVLARGTDYVTSKQGPESVHARVKDMVPLIREWIREDGYEKIFLATEDSDILDRMREEFPGMVLAVAQERHSVSELRKHKARMIYEFEKKIRTGEEYEAALEDTTVNYFYALYMLSRCDAFMCSGQCNGFDVVKAFRDGTFGREYKFTAGIRQA